MNPILDASGAGILFLIVYIVVTVGLAAVGIWILYSVIWRAVRRGMREFDKERPTLASN